MHPFSFFLFGVTGNLAQIKVIPALYDLFEKKMIPKGSRIIGVARKSMTDDEFRVFTRNILSLPNRHHQHAIREDVWQEMAASLRYVSGDFSDSRLYESLKSMVRSEQITRKIVYLATYPQLYETIFSALDQSGLSSEEVGGYTRLMIEKPIGVDTASAKSLHALLARFFEERQIFRLDHYLGKETLQNILTFRFGNGLLEHLFTNEHIDHIQITATEDYGIGRRGQYFDSVGMLKDVGQNHSLQMLSLLTMDAPSEFSNDAVTKQRSAILRQLVPDQNAVVLGQYDGYQGEEFVQAGSIKDTFFALKTEIATPRWQGVPIYIRAGKQLAETCTEMSIIFKTPSNRLFAHLDCGMEPNILTFRIQPNEGIVFRFLSKKPGRDVELESQYMQFCYKYRGEHLPDAYERLIADAIAGDQTFFTDAAEIEAQWEFIDALQHTTTPPLHYAQQSWGPEAAQDLLTRDGRRWLEPSLAVCAI